jgi:hypothetical protein
MYTRIYPLSLINVAVEILPGFQSNKRTSGNSPADERSYRMRKLSY